MMGLLFNSYFIFASFTRWFKTGSDGNYVVVKGDIVNVDDDYDYFELWGKIHNDKGQIVAKAYTNFLNFYSGEKRNFEIQTKLPTYENIDTVSFNIKH